MTSINFLSAGLIAVAMLATPVMAREYSGANGYGAEGAKERAAARYVEGHAGITTPHADALTAVPGTCDVGDNAHAC